MTMVRPLDRVDGFAPLVTDVVPVASTEPFVGSMPVAAGTPSPPLATPSANRTEVAITTELGTFIVELFEDTPISTAKFIDNVVHDLYSGGNSSVQGDAFIHRREADFVIQGGGYYQNGASTFAPIISQITGELGVHANSIYTLSWALSSTDQTTAGVQWFINLRDNATALTQFPVFGQVVGGSAAFNAAATLPTVNLGAPFDQLPALHGATEQSFTTNDLLRVTYDVLGIANADSATVGASAVLSGSSMLANDTDPDSTLAIAMINGAAASFGSTITLASGAKIIVNADGTYSYDPNHVFDSLASGATATDSFTYTLAGGHLVRGTGTVTVTITGTAAAPVNTAPSGADAARTILEDHNYTFAATDFGFSDGDGNSLLAVKITTLPGPGTLTDNGVAVAAGQLVPVADINAGKLSFAPAANANGIGYASFTFQVQDNGGVAGGGVDLDQSPNGFAFSVTPVNDAPSGSDATISVQHGISHVMAAADFGYSDPEGDAFTAVTITMLPAAGTGQLLYGAPGSMVAVTLGQVVTVADIVAGKLAYQPSPGANDPATGSFGFAVQDNGGTANGGLDTDQSANTLTFTVPPPSGPPNVAPTGTDATLTVKHGKPHAMTAADFGYGDSDGNQFAAVTITTVPTAGRLLYQASPSQPLTTVTAGTVISVADINAGKLVYKPTPGFADAQTGSFTFQVHDNGGTANGGIDTDQSPNTITFTVPVNTAPDGTDATIGVTHGSPHVMTAADFGFHDAGGDAFLSVTITTGATAGRLLYQTSPTQPLSEVTAGTVISVADINAGKLIYKPTPFAGNADIGTITFQVHDDAGTVNGGVDTDQTPNTLTFDASSPNRAGAASSDAATTAILHDMLDTSVIDHGSAADIGIASLPALVARADLLHDLAPQAGHGDLILDGPVSLDFGDAVDAMMAGGVTYHDATVDVPHALLLPGDLHELSVVKDLLWSHGY